MPLRYVCMAQEQDDNAVQKDRKLPRVPPAVHGIQVNRCKNPVCENFGLPVAEGSTRGRYADNDYTIVATGAKQPAAKCNSCGEIFGLKSNQGVFEETYRVLASVYGVSTCPDKDCANHRVPTSVEGAYQEFGKTSAGSQRHRCKACGKTFSVKSRTRNLIARQVHSDKNRTILSLLVNKMPLRRICEAADIAPKVLYDRIDFFHERASAFLSEREKEFPGLDVRRLYVGVDRQDHVVNWSQREDKRRADPNGRDAQGNTPLLLASRQRTSAVFPLLRAGADPDAANALGETPFSVASEGPHRSAMVERMLLSSCPAAKTTRPQGGSL